MKRTGFLAISLVLVLSTGGYADTITDSFGPSGPETFWGAGLYDAGAWNVGDVTCVASDTDWRSTSISVPAGNTDGYFGRLSYDSPGYATCRRMTGAATDTDYTVEAKIYTPLLNDASEPDDYLYQVLFFYDSSGAYGRFHSQFNQAVQTRLRIQGNDGAWYTTEKVEADGFTATEGWHTFKVELSGQVATAYYDTTFSFSHDFTGTGVSAGKCGFGTYIDGNCAGTPRSVYIDDFVATGVSSIDDWTLYE